MFSFDMIKFVKRNKTFSWHAFGPPRESTRVVVTEYTPGPDGQVHEWRDITRTDCVSGVIEHLYKEIAEVELAADAADRRFEWVDLIFLSIDGYLRDGGTPMGLALDMGQKQRINEMRKWPDWRLVAPGKAIEHVRGDDVSAEHTPSDAFPPGVISPQHVFEGNGKRCDICFAPREDAAHVDAGGEDQGVGVEAA